jgi:hypothetical protein
LVLSAAASHRANIRPRVCYDGGSSEVWRKTNEEGGRKAEAARRSPGSNKGDSAGRLIKKLHLSMKKPSSSFSSPVLVA